MRFGTGVGWVETDRQVNKVGQKEDTVMNKNKRCNLEEKIVFRNIEQLKIKTRIRWKDGIEICCFPKKKKEKEKK